MQNTITQFGGGPTVNLNSVTPVQSGATINGFSLDGRSALLFRKTTPKNSLQRVRKILVIDRSGANSNLLGECLLSVDDSSPGEEKEFAGRYELLDARDYETARRMMTTASPDLVVADWSTMLMSAGEPFTAADFHYTLPILVLFDQKALPLKIKCGNFGNGVVDCVQKPIELSELRARVQLLLNFTTRLKEMKEENIAIRESLNLKHLEFHLELLMHSGSVKDKFLEDVSSLFPFLNNEGKAKLKYLIKQFKWALNDESSTNFLRAFDKLNEPLYKCLETHCAGITRNEKRLCALTINDQSGSEIAKLMGKTPNCVNVAFARLRGKLGIANNKDLRVYLANLRA